MELDFRHGAGRQRVAHGDQANILVAAVEGRHVQAVLADLEVPAAVNDLPETQEILATTQQGRQGVLTQASLPMKGPGQSPHAHPRAAAAAGLTGAADLGLLEKQHRLGVFSTSIGVEVFFPY